MLVFKDIDRANLERKKNVRVSPWNYGSGLTAYLIRKPEFLKHNGSLQAIRSALGVKSDVSLCSHLKNDK